MNFCTLNPSKCIFFLKNSIQPSEKRSTLANFTSIHGQMSGIKTEFGSFIRIFSVSASKGLHFFCASSGIPSVSYFSRKNFVDIFLRLKLLLAARTICCHLKSTRCNLCVILHISFFEHLIFVMIFMNKT